MAPSMSSEPVFGFTNKPSNLLRELCQSDAAKANTIIINMIVKMLGNNNNPIIIKLITSVIPAGEACIFRFRNKYNYVQKVLKVVLN